MGTAEMSKQKDSFLASEADAWFERNRAAVCDQVPARSEVSELLSKAGFIPTRLLEIGCGNGIRLEQLRQDFGCQCVGVDPSEQAIRDGMSRFPHLSLNIGTADSLQFEDGSFDAILFGFCLYLCDRSDLFKIAFEADRCLMEGGSLAITDFCPPFPYKNRYEHAVGISSYKFDYARMFSWNPAYTEVGRHLYSHSTGKSIDSPDERVASIVMLKNGKNAYPDNPFAQLL